MLPRTEAKQKPPRKLEVKVVQIGNSRGIRLPKALLEKYALRDVVVLEESQGGLLLRSTNDTRLSWEETYKEMAKAAENWADFEEVVADGLDKVSW